MLDKLKGYRTYGIAILTGILAVAHALGYVDNTTYTSLLGFLGAGSIASMRAALPAAK